MDYSRQDVIRALGQIRKEDADLAFFQLTHAVTEEPWEPLLPPIDTRSPTEWWVTEEERLGLPYQLGFIAADEAARAERERIESGWGSTIYPYHELGWSPD